MSWLEVIILSLIQGISEFLPISSSAHLILMPKFFGWKDQGLDFDVALHVGTLIAILWYFRSDLKLLLRDFASSVKAKKQIGESYIIWGVLIGTIPVGIFGLLFNNFIQEHLRSPLVIAFSTIFFALVLWYSDKKASDKELIKMSLYFALLIGFAQALALIPGTSRSGITMSAAMFLGFSRVASARFSFLLSIPVIILAGLHSGVKIYSQGISEPISMLLVAVLLSALSAYACVKLLIELLSRMGMGIFVVYRILLGCFLFYTFV